MPSFLGRGARCCPLQYLTKYLLYGSSLNHLGVSGHVTLPAGSGQCNVLPSEQITWKQTGKERQPSWLAVRGPSGGGGWGGDTKSGEEPVSSEGGGGEDGSHAPASRWLVGPCRGERKRPDLNRRAIVTFWPL